MNISKMPKFNRFCCGIVLGSSALGFGSDLPTPDEMHAAPTVLRSLESFSLSAEEIFLFQKSSTEYVKMPLRLEGKTRTERYGEYVESTRLKVPETKYPGEWRGVLATSKNHNRMILWDASMLQLIQFKPGDKEFIQQVTVPVDRLRPAKDRMGEPTSGETGTTRKKFKQAYRKVFGVRYTGYTPLPPGWIPGSGTSHAFLTKIDQFPLVVMHCDKDDDLACVMQRQCFLENGPELRKLELRGLAVSPKKKLVLIGNASGHNILIYKWESCFNSRYIGSIGLPKKLKKLSWLSLDAAERLWISTHEWENTHDSNLFFWEADQWQNLTASPR